jgi:hypothetical protein
MHKPPPPPPSIIKHPSLARQKQSTTTTTITGGKWFKARNGCNKKGHDEHNFFNLVDITGSSKQAAEKNHRESNKTSKNQGSEHQLTTGNQR